MPGLTGRQLATMYRIAALSAAIIELESGDERDQLQGRLHRALRDLDAMAPAWRERSDVGARQGLERRSRARSIAAAGAIEAEPGDEVRCGYCDGDGVVVSNDDDGPPITSTCGHCNGLRWVAVTARQP